MYVYSDVRYLLTLLLLSLSLGFGDHYYVLTKKPILGLLFAKGIRFLSLHNSITASLASYNSVFLFSYFYNPKRKWGKWNIFFSTVLISFSRLLLPMGFFSIADSAVINSITVPIFSLILLLLLCSQPVAKWVGEKGTSPRHCLRRGVVLEWRWGQGTSHPPSHLCTLQLPYRGSGSSFRRREGREVAAVYC